MSSSLSTLTIIRRTCSLFSPSPTNSTLVSYCSCNTLSFNKCKTSSYSPSHGVDPWSARYSVGLSTQAYTAKQIIMRKSALDQIIKGHIITHFQFQYNFQFKLKLNKCFQFQNSQMVVQPSFTYSAQVSQPKLSLALFLGSPTTWISFAFRESLASFLQKHDVIEIGPKQKGKVLRVVQPATCSMLSVR